MKQIHFPLFILSAYLLLYNREEWFSTFCDFRNGDIAVDMVYFYKLNKKNRQFRLHELGKVFFKSKWPQKLICFIFNFNLQISSFYFKEQWPRKFEIKKFYFWGPQNAQNWVWSFRMKNIFLLRFSLFFTLKNKEYIPPAADLKVFYLFIFSDFRVIVTIF